MKSETGRAMEMTGHGKRGKPTTGFPSFPTALGNRQKHDSHISTAPTTSALEKWKSKSRIPTFPPRLPFIQIKKENNSTRSAAPTFRLILRLEYTLGLALTALTNTTWHHRTASGVDRIYRRACRSTPLRLAPSDYGRF